MKKVIITLLMLSGFWACCGEILTHWNIIGINILIMDENFAAPTAGIVEGDSIYITTVFEPEFVASNTWGSFSTNMLYALSCPDEGGEGLIDKVNTFTVSSSTKFNEYEAGESLNSIISVEGLSLAKWLELEEIWNFGFNQGTAHLKLIGKPLPNQIHIFTVKVELASGKIIEGQSAEIQWN